MRFKSMNQYLNAILKTSAHIVYTSLNISMNVWLIGTDKPPDKAVIELYNNLSLL